MWEAILDKLDQFPDECDCTEYIKLCRGLLHEMTLTKYGLSLKNGTYRPKRVYSRTLIAKIETCHAKMIDAPAVENIFKHDFAEDYLYGELSDGRSYRVCGGFDFLSWSPDQ